MAIIGFTGFEGNINTGGLDGTDSPPFSPGTGSFSTAIKRSGLASARVNKIGAGVGAMSIVNGFNSDGTRVNYGGCATMYVTFYFRYTTKPISNNEEFFQVSDNAGYQLSGRITSGGKVQLYGSGGTTQLGSDGATTLVADTWYKISIRSGSGSATSIYELYIDGVLELSGTHSAIASPSNNRFVVGCNTDRNSQDMDMYFDDVLCSDSGFPDGDVTKNIEIVAIHPTANGTSMSWSAGTGASDYQEVDEVEFDDTKYVMTPSSGTNPNTALFAMEDSATVGISGTILAMKSIILTRENAANVSAKFIRVKSGATNSDSSTFNGSTQVVGQGRILELNPNTATAWTTSTIDAVEIGAVENNNVAVRLINVCGYVVYIPSAVVINKSSFFQFM